VCEDAFSLGWLLKTIDRLWLGSNDIPHSPCDVIERKSFGISRMSVDDDLDASIPRLLLIVVALISAFFFVGTKEEKYQ
jgi:hypothetical protein